MDESQQVLFDELIDPRINEKTGKTYHYVSLKIPGIGTGQMYVTKERWDELKSLKLVFGQPMRLIYRMSLYQGSLEPRLAGIEPLRTA